jgi:autotransporter translocation and assembly factor TamB
MFGLNNDNSKKMISEIVEKYVFNEFGYDIKIQGLKFSLPIIISVKNINLSDQDGEFARVENFYFKITPSINLPWIVEIMNISAEKFEIKRLPQMKELELAKSIKSDKDSFNPNVLIKNILINQLVISDALTNNTGEIITQLKGGVNWNANAKMLEVVANLTSVISGIYYSKDDTLDVIGNYDLRSKKLIIKSAKIESKFLNSQANGTVNLNNNELSAVVSYDSNIAKLFPDNKLEGLNNKIIGEATLSGELDNLLINSSGELFLNFLKNSGVHFPDLKWNSSVVLKNKELSGEVNLEQGIIKMAAEFNLINDIFTLKNFEAQGPEFLKKTNLTFSKGGTITGETKITASNLKFVAQYLPFIKNGDIDLKINYSSVDNKNQSLSVFGTVKNLITDYGNAGMINFDVNISDLWHFVIQQSKVDIKSLNYNDFTIKKLNLSALQNNKNIQIDAGINNIEPFLVDLKMSSILSFQSFKEFSVSIDELFGTLGKSKIKVNHPIKFSSTDKGYNFEGREIKFDKGQINLYGTILSDQIEAELITEQLNIGNLLLNLPSNFNKSLLDSEIKLHGSKNSPVIISQMQISNVLLKKNTELGIVKLNSKIENGKSNMSISVIQKDEKVMGLDLFLPSILSLSSPCFTICQDQPFSLQIAVNKPLDIFALLQNYNGQKIKGEIFGNLRAVGTLNNLELTGKVTVKNGSYQYDRYGVKLNKIRSEVIASGKKILVSEVIIEDDIGNKIIANAEITLSELLPFKANFYTNKFNIIGNPYLQGIIAGNITLTGNKEKAKASGEINLGPFEIKIPQKFNATIPELNIIKVISADNKFLAVKKNLYKVLMDILVTAKDQVFVRGWGVNSLLKGKLSIEGSALEPIIIGKLTSIRGKYQEFGKLLNVESGELLFEGKIPPSPYINIVGLNNQSGTEIRVILSGSLFQPDIQIKSTNAMSQEDALSLLLFGENSKDINTFQALQLANSVSKLSGHGSDFDPMDMSRKIFGIDDITIKTDSNNSNKTVVGIGKYVTEKIYLEVEGGGEVGSRTKIEVELTPKISIENINESAGASSVGIKWHFDY